jgi:hypothetical protein
MGRGAADWRNKAIAPYKSRTRGKKLLSRRSIATADQTTSTPGREVLTPLCKSAYS